MTALLALVSLLQADFDALVQRVRENAGRTITRSDALGADLAREGCFPSTWSRMTITDRTVQDLEVVAGIRRASTTADPATDVILRASLADIAKDGPSRPLARAILAGEIRVAWVAPGTLRGADAVAIGNTIYVPRGTWGTDLSQMLVHEATHVNDARADGLGREARAYRAQFEFLKRMGKTVPPEFQGIERMTDAQLMDAIVAKWPSYGRLARPNEAGRAARGTGTITFVAAYLGKEALKAATEGDLERMRQAAAQLGTAEFWAGLGAFTVAARGTERAVQSLPLGGAGRAIGRAALPLAAGMAAVEIVSGRASPARVLTGTAAYLGAGLAVNAVADGLIYPVLFAAGPPGWIAAGVYTVAKLAVTLYLGEKLDAWLQGLGRPKPAPRAPARTEGILQKLQRVP